MSTSKTTAVLVERRDGPEQVITWNLDRDAPGSNQMAVLVDETLVDNVITDMEGYLREDTIVDSVAMTADFATIHINDFRGLFGSETLRLMAREEKAGHVTYKGRDREILDECYANPELFNQPKSGRQWVSKGLGWG